MNEAIPAYEVGWIQKKSEVGFGEGVPVGFLAQAVKGNDIPPGWEWIEPPEELRARIVPDDEPRLRAMCFGTEGHEMAFECPCPAECEETNRCIVKLLRARDWMVLAKDQPRDELVYFRLGIGTAASAVRTMAHGARLAEEHAKADALEATAAILDMLKK